MTNLPVSRSQWLALALIPLLSAGLLFSPVVDWFDGPQLLSAWLSGCQTCLPATWMPAIPG